MEEQITLDGQKYTILRRHTWGKHKRLDQNMRDNNVSDDIFMRKPRGQKVFHVTVFTNGHYSPIRKMSLF